MENYFVFTFCLGDGCTWSANHAVPVQADSMEEVYVKFSDGLMTAFECNHEWFEVLGVTFNTSDFVEWDGEQNIAYPDSVTITPLAQWLETSGTYTSYGTQTVISSRQIISYEERKL